MTVSEQKATLQNIVLLFNSLISSIAEENSSMEMNEKHDIGRCEPVEMLTIRECASSVHGLSEHTVRKLVAQNKVQYIRTGEGKRGKILVNKASLLAYVCSGN